MKLTEQQIQEMWDWYQARKTQQLSYPVDDVSKAALGVVVGKGTGGSAVTRSQSITSTPTSITVPVNPSGTILIEVEGALYEIPYL